MVAAVAFVPAAGFFVTGTSARIPAKSHVSAFLDEDVPVAFADARAAGPAPMVVSAAAPTAAPASPASVTASTAVAAAPVASVEAPPDAAIAPIAPAATITPVNAVVPITS